MSHDRSNPLKAYVYGMTLLSTIHRLKEGYPKEDTYGEIAQTCVVPGGEAANGATLLSHWGMQVQLDGTLLGTDTREPLLSALQRYGVDCSLLGYDASFEGWKDIVLSGGGTRTVFGWFQALFGEEKKYWNEVNRDAVKRSDVVAVDPFFGDSSERVAWVCVDEGVPFVSVDSSYESFLARKSAAVVISGEFREQHYPDVDAEELLQRYSTACDGIVIFTSGSGPINYAENGQLLSVEPYRTEVLDTLAAGDAFRAGVAYGIAHKLPAERVVRYGAAVAALVCGRFPSIHPVPSLEEVEALVGAG